MSLGQKDKIYRNTYLKLVTSRKKGNKETKKEEEGEETKWDMKNVFNFRFYL